MITHYAEQGIVAVDTHYLRPGLDASHIMIRDNRAAIIDCGTRDSIPHVLDGLAACGLQRSDVDYLIVTHVHLDHAGGAGHLMEALPSAKLLVHPRGARHMIDPSKLWAGASEVYGPDSMEKLYGAMLPIAPERVIETQDGQKFPLANAWIEFLHTPGHAKHHHSVWDPATRSLFTGDTFGLAYPTFTTQSGPFIFPTTTPVHFDPEAMKSSIQRFMGLAPRAAFLTHYGRVEEVERLAHILLQRLEEHVAIAEAAKKLPSDQQKTAIKAALSTTLLNSLKNHGVLHDEHLSLHWWETDLELNAQGLAHWIGT